MGRLVRAWRSLGLKLALLVAVFSIFPVIIYVELRAADQEKRQLLLQSVQEQGELIGEALRPYLATFTASRLPELGQRVGALGDTGLSIKVLLRPVEAETPGSFYFITSSPPVAAEFVEEERAELIATGVLSDLPDTCTGNRPLARRFVNPRGVSEVLTSLTPIQTMLGCWVVVTSHSAAGRIGTSINQPYWQSAEIQLAATVYLLMAVLVITLFIEIWRSLRRFEGQARRIRLDRTADVSFAQAAGVVELREVAEEFDRMVRSLRASAEILRDAAEENAHAFKTPIAVISQSIEPLRRTVPEGEVRARRALELIERSVDRLDHLVAAARRTDRATADLLNPPSERVDLSALLKGMVQAQAEGCGPEGPLIDSEIAPGIVVRAGEDLLETVIENVVQNAVSFSKPGQRIRVVLRRSGRVAELLVEDQGPGVGPPDLDRIFDRYFTKRPAEGGGVDQHFGIGLWMVRRNLEAVGGTVKAANRKPTGLSVRITVPLD